MGKLDMNSFDVVNSELDGIALLEASAGTGKTYSIARLVLRFLLEQRAAEKKYLSISEILIVTFTRASAAELKTRIQALLQDAREELEKRVGAEEATFDFSQLAEKDACLAGILAKAVAADGVENVHRRVSLALDEFDNAMIGTIHSFCKRVIATAAFNEGMPFNSTSDEEQESPVAELVRDFWRTYVASVTSCTPEDTVVNRSLAAAKINPDKLVAFAEKAIVAEGRPLEFGLTQDLLAQSREFFTLHDKLVQTLPERLLAVMNPKKKGDEKPIERAERFKLSSDLLKFEEWAHKASSAKGHDSMRKMLTKFLPEELENPVVLRWLELLEARVWENDKYYLFLTKLWQSMPGFYDRYCRENGITDFNGLLLYAARCVRRPEVSARIAELFPAALIDEFQDTDAMQFEVFEKVYLNRPGTNLLLVGDPKQAIYRFRGADLRVYQKASELAQHVYSLDTNFRSQPALVKAVNALYSFTKNPFRDEAIVFRPVKAGSGRTGLVKRVKGKDKPFKPFNIWFNPGVVANSAVRLLGAQKTAASIKELLAGDCYISGEPIQAKDIAILVSSHSQADEMERVLRDHRIRCVRRVRSSVFYTVQAQEYSVWLQALLEPRSKRCLTRLLIGELMGKTIAEASEVLNDERALTEWFEELESMRLIWAKKGIASAFETFVSMHGADSRILGEELGERRLTNYRQISTLLQQISSNNREQSYLLEWLEKQRAAAKANNGNDENNILKLESEENLIQIVTYHSSKGLQYPVVFLPFMPVTVLDVKGTGLDLSHVHTAEKDFYAPSSIDEIGDFERDEIWQEQMRLGYVSLTRAAEALFMTAVFPEGGRGDKSKQYSYKLQSVTGLFGIEERDSGDKLLEANVKKFAEENSEVVSLSGLFLTDEERDRFEVRPWADIPDLVTLEACGDKYAAWQVSSYTNLVKSGMSADTPDYDQTAYAEDSAPRTQEEIDEGDVLAIPGSADFGTLVHSIFERIDFSDDRGWDKEVEARVAGSGFADRLEKYVPAIRRMVGDVLTTVLGEGLELSQIDAAHRLTEMEFMLNARKLDVVCLHKALTDAGYPAPFWTTPHAYSGYLKGFIDLVFEKDGRYFILDWKTNRLSTRLEDYNNERVKEAMSEHYYQLQYLIYTVALHRHLKRTQPDYDYEKHFGGVYYLFVRGVRPNAGNNGIWYDRPPLALIEKLDAILG